MDDLISIIIPVYNSEQYIEKCVKSVQNQSYSNFELILIDDGSNDESLKICRSLAQSDDRIIVLHQNNGGASSARNTGLKIIKGNYIIFIDSDDFVSPNYFENLLLAAKKGNYDIVQCNSLNTKDINFCPNRVVFSERDLYEVTKIEALNRRKYKVAVWGKIYSSNIFDDFSFQEGIIYEDDASYYIFIYKANKIAILNEDLYFYYLSENSVMRNNKKIINLDFFKIYEDRINYFKSRNEKELLEGSYARFCLVLMLAYSRSIVNSENNNDTALFLKMFNNYYSLVKKSKSLGFKDRVLFSLFYFFPYCTGFLLGNLVC